MKRTRILRILFSILIVPGLLLGLASSAASAPRDFPRPAALEPDVAFWKRIYSEVGTDGGLLHDTHDLSIVYEVTKIPNGLSTRARERHTESRKKHYKDILLRLASGRRSGLSSEEQRVLALFGPGVTDATLRTAADRVRFQLGQADKFRAGVIRSGAYKPHILQVLRDMNLPLEIAHLPHVESSYTPSVYSRVGAAGLWQFTRSTGARFMQVDHILDERLDPLRASVAAARLLEQNYRVTGTWPLAITSYNHGASGMRRAAQKLGTTDITKIVRDYRSRTFGFASRNFYVEFLAADEVATNAEAYFGPLELDRPIAYETTELPWYAKAHHLADALGVDLQTLQEANPGLRPAIWNGSKYVPKGYELRVPREALPRPLTQALAAMPGDRRHARQTRDADYVVRRGDTLSTIARRHGVRMSDLVALNGLRSQNHIRIGQKLRLPSDATRDTVAAAYTPPARSTPPAAEPSRPTAAPSAPREPESLPESGYYVVRRGDNLTKIAERFGMSVSQLVARNDLRSRNRIAVGQRLRVSATPPGAVVAAAEVDAPSHPEAIAALSPARGAEPRPSPADVPTVEEPVEAALETVLDAESVAESSATDESATEPSPGLLADPSDYTVASDGSIAVQTGETLGHYAEWLGLRASRLRQINGLRYGQPLGMQQRIKLDFSNVRPEEFERIRVEFHRLVQEEFFAVWEIDGTVEHRVGPGDSLWVLSTRRFDVPIWLLRQYNPDVDLDALSAGMVLTVPKLRQRSAERDAGRIVERTALAG
ncbi:MAG: LysM peptidoglycan-binding domain-containing protein [Spirochaetaceae bacterium]|nr:LysM peptidoglycan-binding domain-containing protein [Myxococcales bacterium]MCB9724532.1 LysM peptidoglycan-binding domain-containing protein [Spirochaetaceae bacterium]